jgi:hypothetical protein
MRALIAASLVVTAVPVVAAASQESGVTVEAPKQVCRRTEVPASGSRIQRRRVCMTAAQWRERSQDSGDDVEYGEDKLDLLTRGNTQGRSNFKARGPR